MKSMDEIVQEFKNKAVEAPSVSKGYISITESLRAEIKKQLAELSIDIHKQLEIYNESINMIKTQIEIISKKEIERETQTDTAVHIFKFLFGGGCILTIINIIVFILISVIK